MSNTINRPPPSTVAPTASKQAAASSEGLDAAGVEDILKNSNEALSARAMLGGDTSSYTKTFDKNVQAAVAKLGANPSEADVKGAINKEFFNQRIFKFVSDRASNKIMDRVKEMNSDTFN